MSQHTLKSPTFLAYHNDSAIQSRIVGVLQAGIAQGTLIQGQGFYKGFGCKYGLIQQEFHRDRFALLFEEEAGFPATFSHLTEAIYERLPAGRAQDFALRIHKVTRVGAVLDNLILDFTLRVLGHLEWRSRDKLEAHFAIQEIIHLYTEQRNGRTDTAQTFATLGKWLQEECRKSLRSEDLDAQWYLYRAAEWATAGCNPLGLNPLQATSNLLDDSFLDVSTIAHLMTDLLAAARPHTPEDRVSTLSRTPELA
jgi:hypothetical protein